MANAQHQKTHGKVFWVAKEQAFEVDKRKQHVVLAKYSQVRSNITPILTYLKKVAHANLETKKPKQGASVKLRRVLYLQGR